MTEKWKPFPDFKIFPGQAITTLFLWALYHDYRNVTTEPLDFVEWVDKNTLTKSQLLKMQKMQKEVRDASL